MNKQADFLIENICGQRRAPFLESGGLSIYVAVNLFQTEKITCRSNAITCSNLRNFKTKSTGNQAVTAVARFFCVSWAFLYFIANVRTCCNKIKLKLNKKSAIIVKHCTTLQLVLKLSGTQALSINELDGMTFYGAADNHTSCLGPL